MTVVYTTAMAKKLVRFKHSPTFEPYGDGEERLPLSVRIPAIAAMSLTLWVAIFAVLRWTF
jgi:hypothetical protein